MKNNVIEATDSLSKYINQNGVVPGPKKLEQFKKALSLRGTPKLYSQENKGTETIVFVKIFDPCGSWTWYITEWDGEDECFGLVSGFEVEYGYINLSELSNVDGAFGIGLEIDVHFHPTTIGEVKKTLLK